MQLRGVGRRSPHYTLLRLGSREVVELTMAPLPSGAGGLYYVLAAVGIFTLLVGAAVRTRRPFDQATLHFFWLAVAFFGAFTFSFTGRFDRVDWFFYWADAVALAMVPPLFLHFALVFPERPHSDGYTAHAGALAAGDLPAGRASSSRRASSRCVRAGVDPGLLRARDRAARHARAAAPHRASSRRVSPSSSARSGASVRSPRRASCAGSSGARRSGRCRSRVGYVVPFALGVRAVAADGAARPIPLAFIPLAFASAIVRYRLMDVEVILKRLLVYTAVVAAIVAIYVVILRTSGGYFVQTRGRASLADCVSRDGDRACCSPGR